MLAHFVKIDSKNLVVEVIMVDNKDTVDHDGIEREYIGAAFCERGFGGTWIQTSDLSGFFKPTSSRNSGSVG